jgi:signal transduction histidine kinase
MIRALRFRLALGALLFVGLALFLTWKTLDTQFGRYVNDEYMREYSAVIDGLAARIGFEGGAVQLESEPADQRFMIPAGGRYWQISDGANVLLRSRSLWDSDIVMTESSGNALVQQTGPDGEPIMVLSRMLVFDDGEVTRPLKIAVAGSAAEVVGETMEFRSELARMLGLTAVFLLFASGFQIVLGLAPLRRLRTEARAVRSGESKRMSGEGPTEIQPLVREINDLLQEREAAIERARTRASDLAHGLKTPLTVLGHIGEKLSRRQGGKGEGQAIIEQVDTVRKRVDRQLALARIGHRPGVSTELEPIVSRLVTAIKPLSSGKTIEWETDIPKGTTVAVELSDVAEAIGNVLDNAQAWTKDRVRISARNGGERTIITVHDNGPGIAVDKRGIVLDRGGRLDDSRSGTGLGLTISADIFEMAGGKLALDDSPLGGLAVRMECPAGAGHG